MTWTKGVVSTDDPRLSLPESLGVSLWDALAALHAKRYGQSEAPGERRTTLAQAGYAEFTSEDAGIELVAAYCGIYEPE